MQGQKTVEAHSQSLIAKDVDRENKGGEIPYFPPRGKIIPFKDDLNFATDDTIFRHYNTTNLLQIHGYWIRALINSVRSLGVQ